MIAALIRRLSHLLMPVKRHRVLVRVFYDDRTWVQTYFCEPDLDVVWRHIPKPGEIHGDKTVVAFTWMPY